MRSAFNDLTWLAQGGYFHSDQMRVIERFRRDGNTLHYQATVIDPEALLEPWVMNPRVLQAEHQQERGDSRTEPVRGTGSRTPGRQDPHTDPFAIRDRRSVIGR